MKKIIISIFFITSIISLKAQDEVTVTVKGVGPSRVEAINDARREAVGKAYGVSIKSETEVKDFVAIRDAIATQSSGFIRWDTIISETKLRDTYEVNMTAKVSQKVLDKDVKMLAQWLGGLQFLVFFDPREISDNDFPFYEYASERFNQKLKSKDYRYVEKSLIDNFTKREEISKLAEKESEFSYTQKLGASVKSEFIIFIKSLEIRDLGKEGFAPGYKVTIQTLAYDNCTAEGFAPIVMEGSSSIPERNTGVRNAIDDAVNKGFEALLYQFNKYMGDWIATGASFELRFYGLEYEELRDLRGKIKSNTAFGQQLTVNDADDYTKWNLTFNKKQDDMIDFILDNAPGIKLKKQGIYGRLLMFEPRPAGGSSPSPTPTPAPTPQGGNNTGGDKPVSNPGSNRK